VNDPIELKGSFTNYVAKKRWVGSKALIKQKFSPSYLIRALGNAMFVDFKDKKCQLRVRYIDGQKRPKKLVKVIYE